MSSLGEYRYVRTEQRNPQGWVMEFAHGSDPTRRVLAMWKPAGDSITYKPNVPAERIERMPLTGGKPEVITLKEGAVEINESPVFIWFTRK
jgi:hypothetical protein